MAITASIGSVEGGGAMTWEIDYDDSTRQVTTVATDDGWCLVTVQVTNTVTRTVAYYPVATGLTVESQNPDLSTAMPAADFRVVADGQTHVLATGINPQQVKRIVGKAGGTGGLPFTSIWSRH